MIILCWYRLDEESRQLVDSLAKTGATLSLAPIIAKIRHPRYSLWRRNLSHNSLPCQIPSVSSKELTLPRLIRCALSRICCHSRSLLLSKQDKTEREFFLQRLRTPSQDLTHLLDCPASEPLRRVIFGTTFSFGSIFAIWSIPWGVAGRWVSVEFLHVPIPRKGSGSTTTTNKADIFIEWIVFIQHRKTRFYCSLQLLKFSFLRESLAVATLLSKIRSQDIWYSLVQASIRRWSRLF